MERPIEKNNDNPFDYRDDFPYDNPSSVVSAKECTGLMPFKADDLLDVESYCDIYDIPISPIRNK